MLSFGSFIILVDRPQIKLIAPVGMDLIWKPDRGNIVYSSRDMNPNARWFLSNETHLDGLLTTIPVVQTT